MNPLCLPSNHAAFRRVFPCFDISSNRLMALSMLYRLKPKGRSQDRRAVHVALLLVSIVSAVRRRVSEIPHAKTCAIPVGNLSLSLLLPLAECVLFSNSRWAFNDEPWLQNQ